MVLKERRGAKRVRSLVGLEGQLQPAIVGLKPNGNMEQINLVVFALNVESAQNVA
jgi:hypothetical protein